MSTIERLTPGDARGAAAWDQFVMACPQATFFHRAAWQGLLRDVFRHDTHYLFAHSEGRVTGVLPLAHVKSFLFGNALTSLPFAVYGGAVAEDEATAQALEAHAQQLAQRLGVDHLELRQLARHHEGWPSQPLYVRSVEPASVAAAAGRDELSSSAIVSGTSPGPTCRATPRGARCGPGRSPRRAAWRRRRADVGPRL